MAKVTGIGGVFFLAGGDDTELRNWYQRCLGLSLEDFGGAVFNWTNDNAGDGGMTVWHVAKQDSDWFAPSKSPFMINYRVDSMGGIIERLEKEGVKILNGPESHENGKFLWIMDPAGNKVELWEPMLWDDKNKE